MQQGLLVEFSCNSPTLYLIAHWRALLIVRSFVLEWRVVATTFYIRCASYLSYYMDSLCDFITKLSWHIYSKSSEICNEKLCYNLKFLEWDKGQTLVLEKTQENSIESFLQSSLPYIPIQMVCANYCASYPKWPCVKHEVNMCYPCCLMSLFSRSFYFLLLSSMINVVTTPSNVPDVTVWLITSNPKSRVLKIEKIKNKSKIK